MFQVLGSDLLTSLRDWSEKVGWTEAVDACLGELAGRGISVATILDVVAGCTMHAHVVDTLKVMAATDKHHVSIVSDSNTAYIAAVLKRYGLREGIFDQIITNPGYRQDSRLRVHPYCQTRHPCKQCPANLCKGIIVQGIARKETKMERKTPANPSLPSLPSSPSLLLRLLRSNLTNPSIPSNHPRKKKNINTRSSPRLQAC